MSIKEFDEKQFIKKRMKKVMPKDTVMVLMTLTSAEALLRLNKVSPEEIAACTNLPLEHVLELQKKNCPLCDLECQKKNARFEKILHFQAFLIN